MRKPKAKAVARDATAAVSFLTLLLVSVAILLG